MKFSSRVLLKSILLLFVLSFCVYIRALPQNKHLIDSLKNAVLLAKDDTNKVMLLIDIGEQYKNSIPDTALSYYHKALDLADHLRAKEFIAQSLIIIGVNLNIMGLSEKATDYLERALMISEEIKNKAKISTCNLNLGIIYHDKGSYDTAIVYYLKSLETAKEVNFKKGISRSYNNLGRVYYDKGSYEESIDSYLKSLIILEELGDKRNISACYNNIALVHMDQGSYDKAIEYLRKALAINKELGNKRAMSISHLNMANIYNKQMSFDQAIESYNMALKIFEDLDDTRGISECCHNLGETYQQKGSYELAVKYFLKALDIYEKDGDKKGIATLDINLAKLNISLAGSMEISKGQRLKYLNQAVVYGNKSFEYASEMRLLPTIRDAASILMTAYNLLGNKIKALENAGIIITTQDSMFTEDKTRAIQEMSARYETEKKQQQIELQKSQLLAKDAKIKQQKTFRNALIGGLGAFILIIIIITYAYKQKRKDNKKILEQNEKILNANEELKQLNVTTNRQKDEIVSSILYAQRIQSAILPPDTYITELLNENFIFYKPKDIVSGDFYWIKQVNHYIILVAADCTGHGVPAAFLSVLGISCLNEIVQGREITQANQILNELRKEIKQSLRQTGKREESRDGIDIALCVIDTRKNEIQYSGANNPLYIISNNEGEPLLKEINPDQMPVGVHFLTDKSFTNHEIKLGIGDTFYIFSDGFVDQMGGDNNHRYKSEKFKQLLLKIYDQPLYEQKEILEQTLNDWMGLNPQTDDILVIGARV
jgi:serine phosphatase RsbU (regulator of sigma subunit)/Tfp pilus assembly protein PilF